MDALDLLEQQHRDVSDLLDRITAEPSPGARTRMVARAVRMIDAHTRSEERHLYPSCAERLGEHPAKLYAACEHNALARFAAHNLVQTRVTDVRFESRLDLLKEIFTRHAAREETYLFRVAKTHLTDEQLDVIGDDLSRAYERLLESEPDRPALPRRLPRTPPRRRQPARRA